MFARAKYIPESLDELAETNTPRTEQVTDGQTYETHTRILMATADDWLSKVRPLATDLVEGQRYVFFDGHVFPAVHGPIKFRGLWRHHDLPDLPHLADNSVNDILLNAQYWLAEKPD